MSRHTIRFTLLAAMLCCILCGKAYSQAAPVMQDSRGKEFWLTFPQNAIIEGDKKLSLKLFITSDKVTDGTVTIPGLGVRTPFHLEPSQIQEIDIDTTAELLVSELAQKLGVHVVANND